MAFDAIVQNTVKYGFSVNAYDADLSGCEPILAAVTGKSIYLEHIMISCASGITVTIGEGETASAVTTVLLGPIVFTAAGSNFMDVHFQRPIQLTAATALTADASGAGAVTILAEGYVQ